MERNLHLRGDLTLESGKHRFHLSDVKGEAQFDAGSVASLIYLLGFRKQLPKQLPSGLNTDLTLTLRRRPLATVRVGNRRSLLNLHPLRFIRGK